MLAGNGTSSVTVRWDSVNPTNSISVNYVDVSGCMATTFASKSVNVVNPPTPTITGNTNPCQITDGYVYTTEPGMTSYDWVFSWPVSPPSPVPSGIITAGAATNSITTKWYTAGAQTLSVNYITPDGCRSNTQVLNTNVKPVPYPSILSGPASICQGASGTYTAPLGQAQYNWTAPGGTITSGAGTNTVNITWTTSGPKTAYLNYGMVNGCQTANGTFATTVNAAPTPQINTPGSICQGTSAWYRTDFGQSSYNWTVSSGGAITSGQGTNSILVTWNGLGSQSVAVSFTNSSGCTAIPPTVVNEFVYQVPVMTSPTSLTVCSGSAINFPLTSTVTSDYFWTVIDNPNTTNESFGSASSTNPILNGNIINNTTSPQAVVYTITPRSVPVYSSCSGSAQTLIITVNPRPSMTSPSTTTGCSGSPLSLSLTSNIPSTFSWIAINNFNTTGESLTVQNSSVISDIITNSSVSAQLVTYSITPTATVGSCVGNTQNTTASIGVSQTITFNTLPIKSYVDPPFSLIATASSGLPISYTSSNTSVASISGGTATIVGPGTTIITATQSGNSNWCSASAIQTLVICPSNNPTITPSGPTTFCIGGSVILTANSASSYLWSDGATSQSVPISSSGNYSVTVYNSNDCFATTSPTTVTVNPLPTVNVTPTSATICAGNSTNLTASGALSYLWSPSTGLSSNNGASTTASPSSSITYTVTGTSAGGCVNNKTVSVTVNPKPSVTISGPTSGCGYVNLTPGGATNYTWSGPQITSSGKVTVSGYYSLTGTNSYGCSSTISSQYITITPNPTVSIYKSSGNICSGYVNATASATAGSSYYWPAASPYPASSSSTVPVKAGQTRSVTVTKNGCSASASYYAGYCSGGGGNPRIATYTPEVVPEIFIEAALPGIFPNPVDNELNVVLENPVEISAEIKLSELSGKILTSRSLSAGEYKTTIITESIPDGIYLLAILSDSRKKYVKVLVNHSK